ncbi:DivIVA domain-containing protein [Desulfohalobiaceae bacterium Ax17]|jgi:cell division initiation protein|uniref:DivIVA domain-containing protein n=1 Tax=Desulfovulcanus ferrireducens TaxID=2831190 RepID=UPI00207BABC7|nr:DivIVA domain-containing protein [Desulfovulcanus ferrireducens]MBT8763005.1 DivIVA domain-containing protein [Desulfovulcanus ferrireducens]
MSTSKVDILNQKFSTSLFGYKKAEIDIFLQEVADQLGKLAEEKENLQKQVEAFSKSLEEYKSREKILQSTLITTQKMVDDLKANAHKQAKLIVEEAQAKAEDILNQAHKRLAQIHEDITELKRQRTHFEIKLRALIESHLKLLESNSIEEQQVDEIESKLKFLGVS